MRRSARQREGHADPDVVRRAAHRRGPRARGVHRRVGAARRPARDLFLYLCYDLLKPTEKSFQRENSDFQTLSDSLRLFQTLSDSFRLFQTISDSVKERCFRGPLRGDPHRREAREDVVDGLRRGEVAGEARHDPAGRHRGRQPGRRALHGRELRVEVPRDDHVGGLLDLVESLPSAANFFPKTPFDPSFRCAF